MLRSSALVESLENTKKKSHEIRLAFEEATRMNEEISLERNRFRLSAVRGSLMFFLIDQLSMIDHMYQFSLESFMTIFKKGFVSLFFFFFFFFSYCFLVLLVP